MVGENGARDFSKIVLDKHHDRISFISRIVFIAYKANGNITISDPNTSPSKRFAIMEFAQNKPSPTHTTNRGCLDIFA
jgi:hypothetical protein